MGQIKNITLTQYDNFLKLNTLFKKQYQIINFHYICLYLFFDVTFNIVCDVNGTYQCFLGSDGLVDGQIRSKVAILSKKFSYLIRPTPYRDLVTS